MSFRSYFPDRGDLVFVNFAPSAGHEQTGDRPAIVMSPRSYNRRSGLAICCPITTKPKGYPFELLLPAAPGLPIAGAILCDHVRSFDYRERNMRLVGQAPSALVEEALDLIVTPLDAEQE